MRTYWTPSNFLTYQRGDFISDCGRTMLSYRCNRVSGFECSEKRRYIIPKSFLALEQMVSVCLDHVRSEVSSMHTQILKAFHLFKYLTTNSQLWTLKRVSFSRNEHRFALAYIEADSDTHSEMEFMSSWSIW